MGLPSLPLKGETRRRLGEQDRGWRVKLALRAFATFVAFPAFLFFAIANGQSRHYYGGQDWSDGMPLAPILLALIYNPIHLFFSLSGRFQRAIHPAYPLTVDTLVWASAVPSIVFSVRIGWFWWWTPVVFEFDGPLEGDDFILCIGPNFWSKPCQPMIYTLGKMEIAGSVFLGLLLITHFILFIYSCIAAHRHRLARRARRTRTIEPHRRTPSDPESAHPYPATAPAGGIPDTAPPAYAPSAIPSHNTVISGNTVPPTGMHSPTLVRGGAGSSVAHHNNDSPPQLSPVSPINSGSGGGFMGSMVSGFTADDYQQRQQYQQRGVGDGEDHVKQELQQPSSPFHDRFEAKYA